MWKIEKDDKKKYPHELPEEIWQEIIKQKREVDAAMYISDMRRYYNRQKKRW